MFLESLDEDLAQGLEGLAVAIALGCQGQADCTPPRLAEDALGYAFIPDLIDGMQLEVTGSRPHPLSPGDVLIELRGRDPDAAYDEG